MQEDMRARTGDWIGIDWGTSNIRAYLLDKEGALKDDHALGLHIKDCGERGWINVLQTILGDWPVDQKTPVLICGMAGSKFGWLEAPYVSCPAGVNELIGQSVHPENAPDVTILPGLSYCDEQGNYDVIRGEETQLLGLFEVRGLFSGLICAPGTHTKWIEVEDGVVKSFFTSMTGEVFDLISRESILAQSIDLAASRRDGVHDCFDTALDHIEDGDGLLACLFKVRANSLFGTLSPQIAADYLSGLLVGSDVAYALKKLGDLVVSVPVIGSKTLAERYGRALDHSGVATQFLDAESITLEGLKNVARQMGLVTEMDG